MAQPIPFHQPPRDLGREFGARLQRAPEEHAEAILAAYDLLQTLHDHGVLEMTRGVVGGSEKILEQAVEVASNPASIRSVRNLLLLVTAVSEIDPDLLSDLTRAIPKALKQANAEEAKPPGLFRLLCTFFNKDFRRGLAAFNDLLVGFGSNLEQKRSPNND
jgi:uncharacterized protein YjgD (DUF1641 family)